MYMYSYMCWFIDLPAAGSNSALPPREAQGPWGWGTGWLCSRRACSEGRAKEPPNPLQSGSRKWGMSGIGEWPWSHVKAPTCETFTWLCEKSGCASSSLSHLTHWGNLLTLNTLSLSAHSILHLCFFFCRHDFQWCNRRTIATAAKTVPSLWRHKHPAIEGLLPPEHSAGHSMQCKEQVLRIRQKQLKQFSEQTSHKLRSFGSNFLGGWLYAGGFQPLIMRSWLSPTHAHAGMLVRQSVWYLSESQG